MFFEILAANKNADSGEVEWGSTITMGYLPNDNLKYFNADDNLVH